MCIPPGIFWNMGTKTTLAKSNHRTSNNDVSSSFSCIKIIHSTVLAQHVNRRGNKVLLKVTQILMFAWEVRPHIQQFIVLEFSCSTTTSNLGEMKERRLTLDKTAM